MIAPAMRTICFTIIVAFTFLCVAGEARSQGILDKVITISVEQQEIYKVLNRVQAQTGAKFTYSSDMIHIHKKISCTLKEKKLAEFLEKVLGPLGIQYRVIDEHQILLFVPLSVPANGEQKKSLPENASFTVSAFITNSRGEPLAGVSIVEKNTTNGTVTDASGRASISVSAGAVLLVSLVGFVSKEVKIEKQQTVHIELKESVKAIDEVIVTGVFDKRKRMESAVAITTLNAEDIEKQAFVSAADILTNVPGVYVNSSLGEVRNVVYSRGVSANSTDGASGYYYVSLQEDGLPVTNVTFSNFGPDYFYRPDASFRRLEAVRGGTASIFGANAPGGIFNYLSKTGGEKFAGLVKAKYGIEGDGNGYYRGDINVGGPLNKKGWHYNAGGFYRYSLGARYPGYPLNHGGQVKGNIVKQYKKGAVTFYIKHLDDHNGWYEFLPAKNFDHPKLAPGVKQTDSYLLPEVVTEYPFLHPDESRTFDPKVLAHSKETALGQSIEQNLGNGWKITNNLKYSEKKQNWQSSALIYPLAIDDPDLYYLLGVSGMAGTYSFRDPATGTILAQAQSKNGSDFTVSGNQLPGQSVLPKAVLTELAFLNLPKVQEWMDQFYASKKINRMTFTAGAFYARSHVSRINTVPGIGLGVIKNRPQLLDITVTDSVGKIYQLTNAEGYTNLGGCIQFYNLKAIQNDLAGFFGNSWQISNDVNLDAGFRYGYMQVKGSNNIGVHNPRSNDLGFGGVDGNPLTLFDNKYFVPGATYSYHKSIHTYSYSLGMNYKVSSRLAVYARYSSGQKAPDLNYYFSYDSEFKIENDRPKAQRVSQAEMGLKVNGEKLKVFVTPFYSLLANVYNVSPFQNRAGGVYFPLPVHNSVETYGLELETRYEISSRFNVRAIATFQTAKTKDWKVWIANAPGAQDDRIADYSGKKADNNPNVMLHVTPSYTAGKFYALCSWKYMGKRPGNVPNTITLPGFSQFDTGLGYKLHKNITLSANINNLLNSEGVMSWSPPGGYPVTLDRQGFTKEKLAANPGATFSIISIQPRSFFLNFSYSF